MTATTTCTLPCVVQVGFAGSRRLFNTVDERQPALLDQAEEYLLGRLQALPAEIGLSPHHFLCGVSQVAQGADLLFSSSCERLDIPQCIFLPQHQDAYLSAIGESGPDFTPQARSEAQRLLECRHVIQRRLVSSAADRQTRFEDATQEILRVSQVIICMLRADVSRHPTVRVGLPATDNANETSHSAARPGGTLDMLEQAIKNPGVPVLEIRVSESNGTAEFAARWHNLDGFRPPELPDELHDTPLVLDCGQRLPTVEQFTQAVTNHTGRHAQQQKDRFARAALVVIAAHILATMAAAYALALHAGAQDQTQHGPSGTTCILLTELILLAGGFWLHRWIHHKQPSALWAMSRLLAEINRSIHCLGPLHVYPGYLFRLRLSRPTANHDRCVGSAAQADSGLTDQHNSTASAPESSSPTSSGEFFEPLLRTLGVLHLLSTRGSHTDEWHTCRDAYVKTRLGDQEPEYGQIAYYRRELNRALRREKAVDALFMTCSLLAMAATTAKLLHLWKPELLGMAAVVLPVLAVGFLSWASAMDYRARVQTYTAMIDFLVNQKSRLQGASTAAEFHQLVDDTELRLLGEVADWYSRRMLSQVS